MPSQLPVAIRSLRGLKPMLVTRAEWPFRVTWCLPVVVSHTRTELSAVPAAAQRPLLLKLKTCTDSPVESNFTSVCLPATAVGRGGCGSDRGERETAEVL